MVAAVVTLAGEAEVAAVDVVVREVEEVAPLAAGVVPEWLAADGAGLAGGEGCGVVAAGGGVWPAIPAFCCWP